jgi:hypothetical protein
MVPMSSAPLNRHTAVVIVVLAGLSLYFAIGGPGWISLGFGVLLVLALALTNLDSLDPGTRMRAKMTAAGFEVSLERTVANNCEVPRMGSSRRSSNDRGGA